MKPLVVSIPGEVELARQLARRLDADLANMEIRSFPDQETYVRIDSPVEGRLVVVAASLDRPNSKFLPLFCLIETARDLGADQIGLVTPYLSYMRQDDRFRPGEGITSRYVGSLISDIVDWMVTVEPHLHRYEKLSEIYAIPSRIVGVAESIAAWIDDNVEHPILIGPDEESDQWVDPVAEVGNFPSVILEKIRHGDYDVNVEQADDVEWSDRQPVLIDDIISTGRTMLEAVEHVTEQGLADPICIGIHGLFVEDAYEQLQSAGVADVVTCNTVAHSTNAIDVYDDLAAAVESIVGGEASVAVAPKESGLTPQ